VQLDAGRGDGVEETGDAGGIDALRAGSGGREAHARRRYPQTVRWRRAADDRQAAVASPAWTYESA
jgi:hypothetical protein